jgi:hypothetical protein
MAARVPERGRLPALVCFVAVAATSVPADEPREGALLFSKYVNGIQVLGNENELWCFVCLYWNAYPYHPPGRLFYKSRGGVVLRTTEQWAVRFDGTAVTDRVRVRFDKPGEPHFHPNINRIMRVEETFFEVHGYDGFMAQRGKVYKLKGPHAIPLGLTEVARLERLYGLDMARDINILWPRIKEETRKAGWNYLFASPELYPERRGAQASDSFCWKRRRYKLDVPYGGSTTGLQLHRTDDDNAEPVRLLSWQGEGPLRFPDRVVGP